VVSVDSADAKTPKVTIDVGKPLARSHTLSELKAMKAFESSLLARNSRLSVVPLTEEQYSIITGK
jgi:predicted RNA-binding protein with PUA-like domain